MKSQRRQFDTLNLSAIDLFASALGAFVIITSILLPYYPNMKDGGKTTERLISEIKALEQDTAQSQEEARRIESEKQNRLREIAEAKKATRRKAELEKKSNELEARGDALSKVIAELRKDLDKYKKLNREKRREFPAAGDTDFSIMGITTKAKSFVILVDLSGSMIAWSDVLIDTLYKIIDPYHDDVKFAILGYQGFGVTQYWPSKGRYAIADKRSKASARTFIRLMVQRVEGSTPTKSALISALGYRPQSIILVSDGAPDDEEPDKIVSYITGLNQNKVEINTVAVGDYLKHTSLINFLNDLAKRNKGQFVGVIR